MADQVENIHPRIYQLDDLILDVYNAVYAKSGKYQTQFFDATSLKPERFKLFDYDLDIIFDRTKIQYWNTFPTGFRTNPQDPETSVPQICFKRQGETHMTTIRIIPYSNKDAVDDMTNPVNVNQIIKTLMSELVVNDRTNNLLLPIINVDVEGSDLAEYEKVKPFVDNNKFYSVEITEKFYSLTTLENYLRDYPVELRSLRSIIYQAVDVLNQINLSYTGFRYNQLIPSQIDCYLKQIDDVVLPELKLGNFFLAEIDEIVPNSYLKKAGIQNIGTPYSDVYQLLNFLWNNYQADIKKYPELLKLFNAILPEKIRSNEIYLTQELWDKLTDDEKTDLKIKNIRNNPFFSSKDSLSGIGFVEARDIENSRIVGTNNDNINENIESEHYDDFEESETMNDEINYDNSSTKLSSFSSVNKKSSDNDIDIMGNNKNSNSNNNKKSNNKKKMDIEDDNDSNDMVEETEEKISVRDIPSRIVNVSGSDYKNRGIRKSSGRTKEKIYHGNRKINNFSNEPSVHSQSKQLFGFDDPSQHEYGANMMNNNSGQSRINSLGALLGTNQNDLSRMASTFQQDTNKAANYSQMMQQFMQQQNPSAQPMTSQQIPNYAEQSILGQTPPNQLGSIPSPVLNPIASQNQMSYGQDQAALAKYLSAIGQNPNAMPQGQQIDSNLANLFMQQAQGQQVTNQPMNYPPPQQIPYDSQNIMQQMGGGKRNQPNFFFQPGRII